MHRLIVMKLIAVTHYYSLSDPRDIVDIFKVTGSKFKVTGSILKNALFRRFITQGKRYR